MATRSKIVIALLTAVVSAGCGDGGSSGGSSASTLAAAGAATSSVGAFVSGPDLNTPRGQHTATLLRDGRVLVVGGTDGSGILADAEIFDPLTNTWQLVRQLNPAGGLMLDATGSFPTARQLHSATLLSDGRVLIAGGVGIERLDASGAPVMETLSSAFVFDPETNAFSSVGSLTSARAWHLGAAVGRGAVLAGGLDENMRSLASADVFDPDTNTFSSVPTNEFHTWGSFVSAGGGALLVGGADVSQTPAGWTLPGAPAIRAELFTEGVFTQALPSAQDLVQRGAASTRSGAFFAGGQEIQDSLLVTVDTTERFDASSGTFAAGPSLATARSGCLVASPGSGDDQLVMGGVDADGRPLRSCELWSAASNAILGTVNMVTPRTDFQAVTLSDGRIFVIGGLDGNSPVSALAQTEFYR